MKPTRIALMILAAAALSACQPDRNDKVAQGKAYFDALGCAQCHAIGEKGNKNWGPDLTMIGHRKSKEWLNTWLKDPHAWRKETVMPNFHLNDETREAIVSYLSEQKGQAWDQAGGRPWNQQGLEGVKRGEVLFNKAGCVACHSQNGRGGYPNNNVVGGQIPSLSKVAEGYTKDELMNKIRNGVTPAPADPSQPAPLVFMPKWGEVLKDDEIASVAEFLMSLGKKGGKAAPASDW